MIVWCVCYNKIGNVVRFTEQGRRDESANEMDRKERRKTMLK